MIRSCSKKSSRTRAIAAIESPQRELFGNVAEGKQRAEWESRLTVLLE
jgi:hypothetical protein